MAGARITGQLRLRHATIEVPFSLVDCLFDEPVELSDASLRAADFTGCHMPGLSADRMSVAGDLTFARLNSGRLSLFGAQVGGNLWLTAARIMGDGVGYAVDGPQLHVEGGLYARSAHVTGGVNLWGAQAFTIEFSHARLAGRARSAFRGDGLRLIQDLHCNGLRVDDGGIRLFGSKIGGQCWLVDADVRGDDDWAINAPVLSVGGGFYARGLNADGGVNLFAATIGESIDLISSALRSSRGHALRISGTRVEANISLNDSMCTDGDFNLTRIEAKGALCLTGATFSETTTVDLHGATLGTLRWETLGSPPAMVDLSSATVSVLTDTMESWPSRVTLSALTYQTLQPILAAGERLAWLRRDPGYHPQPYEQLAACYRRLGHDDDARTVLLARHRRRRCGLRVSGRLWGYVEDAAVGYGYRPGRALLWLLALTAAVAAFFSIVPPQPTRSDGPAFQPIIFALDLILPILDLGQQKAFATADETAWVAWLSSLSGWLLGTSVITSVTRRIARF
ncbi:hypothetical protein [Streptomyces sp. NPDC088757]|uniref:hypothetical protein n=1 Tax=Streptomyces sp. NPDC088757 TaxID=3365889 RepID=UPI003824C7B7